MKFSAATIFFLCVGSFAHAVLIYDVKFSSQTDIIGASATTGGSGPPFLRPTQVNFGTSQVLAAAGGLADRPLQLIPQNIGSFQYSQYQFNINAFDPEPIYQLDFDLLLSNMAPSPGHVLAPDSNHDIFTVLFDTPTVTRLDFWDAGRISQNNTQIGTFSLGQAFHLSVLVDLPHNRWTIAKDSSQLFSGQFFVTFPAQPNPPTLVQDIRFNLADSVADAGLPFAAVDNIRIVGSTVIPEPTTAFFGAAVVIVIAIRRRQ